jgi:hypothetical protein
MRHLARCDALSWLAEGRFYDRGSEQATFATYGDVRKVQLVAVAHPMYVPRGENKALMVGSLAWDLRAGAQVRLIFGQMRPSPATHGVATN